MTTRLGACRQSGIKCPDNWCATARVIQVMSQVQSKGWATDSPHGRCSKGDCAMMQRYDLCTEQLSAWLLVLHCTSASDNRFHKTVHASGSVVQRLAGVGDGEVTVDDLLNAPPDSRKPSTHSIIFMDYHRILYYSFVAYHQILHPTCLRISTACTLEISPSIKTYIHRQLL